MRSTVKLRHYRFNGGIGDIKGLENPKSLKEIFKSRKTKENIKKLFSKEQN